MSASYRRDQIHRVLAAGPNEDEDWFRIVVSGREHSKQLNVTAEELGVIATILFREDTRSEDES